MASKGPPNKQRRPPPTIDLSATEVRVAPASATPSGEPDVMQGVAATPPEAAVDHTVSPAFPDVAEPMPSDPISPDPAPAETAASGGVAATPCITSGSLGGVAEAGATRTSVADRSMVGGGRRAGGLFGGPLLAMRISFAP